MTALRARCSAKPWSQPRPYLYNDSPSQSFSTAPPRCSNTLAQKRKHRDPYALAQARQRKAANLARQATLKKEREAALGRPVLGKSTSFINSLESVVPRSGKRIDHMAKTILPETWRDEPEIEPQAIGKIVLNHSVTPTELREAVKRSHYLTEPMKVAGHVKYLDSTRVSEHKEAHETARKAMARITSLSNGSKIDQRRVQIKKCVETFGRHNTDKVLPPKPPANIKRDASLPPAPTKTPRAGPDTGSAEVQISVLTLKIRALAKHLSGYARTDKVNKRNLQLLVHRRQKLLKYLRRKERGGARWQHLMETLGLTDAMWKGEISLP